MNTKDLVQMIDIVIRTDLETEEMTVIILGVIEVMKESMIAVEDVIIDMMTKGMMIEDIAIGDVTIVIQAGIMLQERIDEKRLYLSLNPR